LGADDPIGEAAFLVTRHQELVCADRVSGSPRNNYPQQEFVRQGYVRLRSIGNPRCDGRDCQAEQQNGHTDFDSAPDGTRKCGCISGVLRMTPCGPDRANVNN
jgi:hypothetical protein